MSTHLRVQSSFRVYRDKPSSFPLSKAEANAKGRPITSRRRMEVSSATDKENIHPVTGLPPRMLTSASKKRKTDVLTTKLMAVKEVTLSPKKRKVFSSTSTVSSARSQKQGRLSTKMSISRRGIRSRSTTNLRVDETAEERRGIHDRTLLASDSADARCYELTVIPLADISEAYETSSDDDSVRDGTSTGYRPEIPILGPSGIETPGTPRSERTPSSPIEGVPTITLATPDRKRIYSAFTFTSSSLASRRDMASKSSHEHQFLDVPVDPLPSRC